MEKLSALMTLCVRDTNAGFGVCHHCDVIMGAIAPQITSLTTVYSDADQRKHQSSASLAFVRGIHRSPVNSPHKWAVTRKLFPFDDVIMFVFIRWNWPRKQWRCWWFETPWHSCDVTVMKSHIQLGPCTKQTFCSLQWRHNERDGISNHRRLDCVFNRMFRRRSKKTSKLRVTGLCERNSPVTGEFTAQKASNAKNVSIWWRHYVFENTHNKHHLAHQKGQKGRISRVQSLISDLSLQWPYCLHHHVIIDLFYRE